MFVYYVIFLFFSLRSRCGFLFLRKMSAKLNPRKIEFLHGSFTVRIIFSTVRRRLKFRFSRCSLVVQLIFHRFNHGFVTASNYRSRYFLGVRSGFNKKNGMFLLHPVKYKFHHSQLVKIFISLRYNDFKSLHINYITTIPCQQVLDESSF